MSSIIRHSFIWQFVAGFAIGAAGLVAVHATPAHAATTPTHVVQR